MVRANYKKFMDKVTKVALSPTEVTTFEVLEKEDLIKIGMGDYDITVVDGYMRCTCPDFFNRAGTNPEGSYLCKHCINVVMFLVGGVIFRMEGDENVQES